MADKYFFCVFKSRGFVTRLWLMNIKLVAVLLFVLGSVGIAIGKDRLIKFKEGNTAKAAPVYVSPNDIWLLRPNEDSKRCDIYYVHGDFVEERKRHIAT